MLISPFDEHTSGNGGVTPARRTGRTRIVRAGKLYLRHGDFPTCEEVGR